MRVDVNQRLLFLLWPVVLSGIFIKETAASTWAIDVSGIQGYQGSTGCSVKCDDGAMECSLKCKSWGSLAYKGGAQGAQGGCGPGAKKEYSSCCTTCQTYKILYGVRSRGTKVYVLHEPWKGEWQLIPVGRCSYEKSSCRGACVTRYRAYPVKVTDRPVWTPWSLRSVKTWYEWPSFPSYCACESGGASLASAPVKPIPTTTQRPLIRRRQPSRSVRRLTRRLLTNISRRRKAVPDS